MPIKFGTIVTEASGKIGGNYLVNHRCGATMRRITTKPKRRTANQQSQRINYSLAVQAWHALSPDQVAYYNSIAPKSMNGYNYFLKLKLSSKDIWDDSQNWDDSKNWVD